MGKDRSSMMRNYTNSLKYCYRSLPLSTSPYKGEEQDSRAASIAQLCGMVLYVIIEKVRSDITSENLSLIVVSAPSV
jgi:hypothetical protein